MHRDASTIKKFNKCDPTTKRDTVTLTRTYTFLIESSYFYLNQFLNIKYDEPFKYTFI